MIENKILLPEETEILRDMICSLAKYHNETAENKEITYPTGSIDDTIQTLSDNIANGESIIKAYFDNNTPIAFCCIGIHREEKHGELKYLFVQKSYRKHGLGDTLMQWAMEEFKKAEIDFIDIRVVIGNPAACFYKEIRLYAAHYGNVKKAYKRKITIPIDNLTETSYDTYK